MWGFSQQYKQRLEQLLDYAVFIKWPLSCFIVPDPQVLKKTSLALAQNFFFSQQTYVFYRIIWKSLTMLYSDDYLLASERKMNF